MLPLFIVIYGAVDFLQQKLSKIFQGLQGVNWFFLYGWYLATLGSHEAEVLPLSLPDCYVCSLALAKRTSYKQYFALVECWTIGAPFINFDPTYPLPLLPYFLI